MPPPAVGTEAVRGVDVVLALAVTAAAVLTLLFESTALLAPAARDADGWAVLLTVAMTLPLAVRRRLPVLAAGVSWLAGTATTLAEYAPVLAFFATLYLLGEAAYRTDRRRAAGLAVAGLALGVVPLFLDDEGVTLTIVLGSVAIGVLPALVGDALRTERAYALEVRDRALRLDSVRAAELRRAVADERLRIARDVHDTVGHHLSAITVSAGAAARTLPADGDGGRAARAALDAVADLGSEALAETRRVLGLLRGADEPAELEPQPGLDDIDGLAAAATTAGVPTRVEREGRPRPLSEAVEGCAYRVVQEALTNAVRHAGPARATVRLRYTPAGVELEVADDGRGPAGGPAAEGHGVLGMRERVRLVGGTLEAGARAPRGWRVHATLPERVGLPR